MIEIPSFVSTVYAADTTVQANSHNIILPLIILAGLWKCASIAKRETTSAKCVYALALSLTGLLFISLHSLLKASLFSTMPAMVLFALVFIVVTITAICFAIYSLIDYKNHPEYTQGKAQAISALVLSSILFLAFSSGVFIAIIKKAQSGFTDTSTKAITGKKTFDDLNFSFDVPPGYKAMDNKIVNEDASISLMKAFPRLHFIIIAETLGADLDVSTEALKEISQSFLKSADPNARIFDETEIIINDMPGIRFYSDVKVNRLKLTYAHWVFAKNGYGYQLIAWGKQNRKSDIQKEANALFRNFRQIDSQRIFYSLNTKPYESFTSPRFNYSINLENSSWVTWTELPDEFPEAETGALMKDNSAFLVIPVSYDTKPHMEALTQTLMKAIELPYPSNHISGITPFKTETSEGIEFRYDSGKYSHRNKLIAGMKHAILVSTWAWDGSNPDELHTQVISGLTFKPEAPPAANTPLSAKEKSTQAIHLNRFGLFYNESKQFEKSLSYFKIAVDNDPGNETYLVNTLTAFNQLKMYKEGLLYLEPLLPKYKGKHVVTSWHAWFLQMCGNIEKSISVYRLLFEEGFRNDSDFTDYITLLSNNLRWEEADTAFELYFKKGTSIDLKLLQAKCLSRQKKYDKAISILNTLQSTISFNPTIAYALIDNYQNSNQLTQAYTLCNSLISNGYASAHAYYTKGDVEYSLKRYKASKASLEKALSYTPDDPDIKNFLRHVSSLLGEGDNSAIKQEIAPVPLPNSVIKAVSSQPDALKTDGYNAYYNYIIEGYAFSPGKEVKRSLYKKIKIINSSGVEKFSTMEIDFNPLTEMVYVNTLNVLSGKGAVLAKGNPSDYYVIDKQKNTMATYEQTLNITVPNLSPGNVIELVVTVKKKNSHKTFPFYEIPMIASRPVQLFSVFYTGSPEHIRSHESNMKKPVKTTRGLVWSLKTPAPYQWEPLQVDYESIYPVLKLSDASSQWKSEGLNYLKDIKERLQSDSRTASVSRSLTSKCKTENEKIITLANYVQQNYTYKAIEFGRRSWLPNLPSTIMANKYGDCKDHAVLLHQLLTDIGINSYLTLVSTESQIEKTLPSMDQFNHMILYIPGKKSPGRFIDTTDKGIDMSIPVPAGTGGYSALILNPDNIHLKTIPHYEAGSSTASNLCTVTIAADGNSVTVDETLTLSGYCADFMRSHLKDIEKVKQSRWAKSVLTDYHKNDTELVSFETENLFTSSNDLVLKLTYRKPCPTPQNKKGLQFELPSTWDKYYLDSRPVNKRLFPFEIMYPFELNSSISINNHASITPMVDMPGKNTASHPFGGWKMSSTRSGNSVNLEFKAVINSGIYPAERYQEYCRMLNSAVSALSSKISFNRSVTMTD